MAMTIITTITSIVNTISTSADYIWDAITIITMGFMHCLVEGTHQPESLAGSQRRLVRIILGRFIKEFAMNWLRLAGSQRTLPQVAFLVLKVSKGQHTCELNARRLTSGKVRTPFRNRVGSIDTCNAHKYGLVPL